MIRSFALALAVTAAVTIPGPGCAIAQSQDANHTAGSWRLRANVYEFANKDADPVLSIPAGQPFFADKATCEQEVGNLNEVLYAVADPAVKGEDVPDPKANEQITTSVAQLVMGLMQRTGEVPLVKLSCELMGDPA